MTQDSTKSLEGKWKLFNYYHDLNLSYHYDYLCIYRYQTHISYVNTDLIKALYKHFICNLKNVMTFPIDLLLNSFLYKFSLRNIYCFEFFINLFLEKLYIIFIWLSNHWQKPILAFDVIYNITEQIYFHFIYHIIYFGFIYHIIYF